MKARYAQEYGGQKLHIVEVGCDSKTVRGKAICGRNCYKRGSWRMTLNVSLAGLCKNCSRIAHDIRVVEF